MSTRNKISDGETGFELLQVGRIDVSVDGGKDVQIITVEIKGKIWREKKDR